MFEDEVSCVILVVPQALYEYFTTMLTKTSMNPKIFERHTEHKNIYHYYLLEIHKVYRFHHIKNLKNTYFKIT